MGSLMSGWSSTVLGDKKVRLMRNRSLTKEEVEAFWRQRGRRPPDNGDAAAGSRLASPRVVGDVMMSPLPPSSPRAEIPLAARRLEAMRSLPTLPPRSTGTAVAWSSYGQYSSSCIEPSSPAARDEVGSPKTAAEGITSWWTSSSWAFLNEPPPNERGGVSVRQGAELRV